MLIWFRYLKIHNVSSFDAVSFWTVYISRHSGDWVCLQTPQQWSRKSCFCVWKYKGEPRRHCGRVRVWSLIIILYYIILKSWCFLWLCIVFESGRHSQRCHLRPQRPSACSSECLQVHPLPSSLLSVRLVRLNEVVLLCHVSVRRSETCSCGRWSRCSSDGTLESRWWRAEKTEASSKNSVSLARPAG